MALHLLRALSDADQDNYEIKGKIPSGIKLVHFVKENEFDEIIKFREQVE